MPQRLMPAVNFKNTINFLKPIRTAARDHYRNKYVSYGTAVKNWFKFRNVNYEMYNLESVTRFKASETIFILGSGPSLNLLMPEQIKTILNHDSCGINYSFLKAEIVPTFQLLSYEPDPIAQKFIVELLSPKRKLYSNTVFFLNNKTLFRLGHPRITPCFFPEQAKCCFYWLPESIHLEKPRPFTDEDFDKTLVYRGTLTVVLDLVLKLKYKKIVLLGIDPDTPAYFFDAVEEMKEYCAYHNQYWDPKKHKVYENMVPKGNKFNTIDVYLYSLKDYLLRKRGVELFVGFKGSMLYPKLSAYFD